MDILSKVFSRKLEASSSTFLDEMSLLFALSNWTIMYVLVQPFLGIYGMQSIHDICNAFRIVCLDTIKEVALKCRKYSFCMYFITCLWIPFYFRMFYTTLNQLFYGDIHIKKGLGVPSCTCTLVRTRIRQYFIVLWRLERARTL